MSLSTQQCCAVKSLSMSKQADGSVSVTVTALKGDAEAIAINIIRGFGRDYELTSWRDEPPLMTVSAISKSASTTRYRVGKAGIFKSIPQEIYKLYQSGLYHKSIVPVTYEPDVERFIRPSEDIYGALGWTVKEIFKELGIAVDIPGALDYHVYQLAVQKNTPVISLLRTLFPIPGILIYYYHHRFYVSMPTGDIIPDAHGLCKLLGESTNTVDYEHEVMGQQGEPLYIKTDEVERVDSAAITSLGSLAAAVDITYNLVGGVFCINERETTAMTASIVIEEYFNEFNRNMAPDAEDNHGHEEEEPE